MASHAAMLLNPKGSKRQAQSNGNPPSASSPASDLPPVDAVAMFCEFPSDNSRPVTCSPALSFPALPGASSHVSTPIHVNAMDTSAMPRVLDSPEDPVHLDTQMDTRPMSTDMMHSADFRLPTAPQMDTSVMHTKSLGPTDSVSPCALNSLDPSSSFSSHSSSSFVTSSPTDPMLLDPTDSQGLLLECTGKHQGNGSSPGSPMATVGTAADTRFHQSTIRTSPNVPSEISTPVVKPESNLTVQFTTTRDEDMEIDTKRSHREMSDEEDIVHRPNLIENVYGVEKRKNQPAKKVKTEHEKPNMANAPVSISGNSGLGKWMKEEEAKSTPIPNTPNVVDLTAGMRSLFLLSADFVQINLISF